MKMVRAHGHFLCKGLKGYRFFARVHKFAGSTNTFYALLIQRRFIWLAAFTGPKAGRLCSVYVLKETDILTQRVARPARRAAKNTGGDYTENELLIGIRVAVFHRLPARVVGVIEMLFHGSLLFKGSLTLPVRLRQKTQFLAF